KSWNSSLETYRRLRKEADHAFYYFLAMRSLMKWHTKSIQSRKRKRQGALENCLKNRKVRMITLCISHWRQRTTECLNAQKIADQIRHERDLDMIEDVFLRWNEK